MSKLKGLSNSDIISIGFKPSSRFAVGKQCLYQLSRSRYLSAMCIGQGNESVWLCHKGKGSEITDIICIHNRDYDGFITLEKLKTLIEWFG